MPTEAKTADQQRIDEEAGFRPLLTRAPLLEDLVASPTEYDAAPTYLTREYLARTSEVRKTVLAHQASLAAVEQGGDSVRRQVGIALELAAPIGFGLVRAHALALTAAHYLLVAGNPITAVLSAPALFLTGKKLVTDLRRAFTTDPKVRELSTRASRRVEAGDHRGAEALLKEALEQDINPDYRRNGDLYLQLGLTQMRDGRPRQAMVAFARASVLFHETDAHRIQRDGRTVEVSKRGIAELLAVSAIDSFASSEAGLDEWSELLGDFATSARLRLEAFASRKEQGRLYGLFGVDDAAAELGRELVAKVAFLAAKMDLRALGASLSPENFERLLDEGLAQLDAASLSDEEHLNALLEQAQFYASSVQTSQHAPVRARAAMKLLTRAADLAEPEEPGTAARIRAEALSFLLEVIPEVAGTAADAASFSALLLPVVESLERQLEGGQLGSLPMAPILHGWLPERRYLLADDPAARRQAIRSSVLGYQRADEPVAAMHSALRLAYCADGPEDEGEALGLLRSAARGLLAAPGDPVSMAFAGKYLLDASTAADEGIELDRAGSAANFLAAADRVRNDRGFVAFYVHGKPLLHPWQTAELVLRGHAAAELARAGQEVEALAILETLRYRLEEASPRVRQALELERAVYLLEGGQRSDAVQLLERIEREAREAGTFTVQQRALQLLAAAERAGSGLARAAGLQRAAPPAEAPPVQAIGPGPVGPAAPAGGIVGPYAAARTRFLGLAVELLAILAEPELQARLGGPSGLLAERARSRIQGVEDNVFRIAIVGEFSSGKSTLLNAVLGASILPASIRPTTSVVNILRFGEEAGLRVLLESGEERESPLSSLKDYVTERRNPGNERGVSQVTIEAPVDLLRDGVELVDTPGLQSLVEAHTRLTYALVPTCDAVVLIAAARQPFSESLGSFLEDVRGFVDDKVFYVLNKVDQLEADGLRQARSFAAERVADHVEGAQVFGVSAYRALAGRRLASGEACEEDYEDDPRLGVLEAPEELVATSGFPQLEAALGRFLSRTRGIPLLLEQALGFSELLSEVEGLLAAERQAASLSLQEVREAHRRLTAEHAQRRAAAERVLEGLDLELQEQLRAVRTGMLGGLDDGQELARRRVVVTPESISSEEGLERLKVELRSAVRAEAGRVVRFAGEEIREAVTRHRLKARNELRTLQSDLRAEFGAALGLEVGDALSSLELTPVHVEAGGWGVVAGNFAVGGMLGFVGGFLLGPIGIGLAMFGGAFIENWLQGRRVEAAQGQVSDAMDRAFSTVRENLTTAMETLSDEVAQRQRQEIAQRRDEILAQFDLQLEALADQASTEREEGAERDRSLRGLQDRAAGLRASLRRFAQDQEVKR